MSNENLSRAPAYVPAPPSVPCDFGAAALCAARVGLNPRKGELVIVPPEHSHLPGQLLACVTSAPELAQLLEELVSVPELTRPSAPLSSDARACLEHAKFLLTSIKQAEVSIDPESRSFKL